MPFGWHLSVTTWQMRSAPMDHASQSEAHSLQHPALAGSEDQCRQQIARSKDVFTPQGIDIRMVPQESDEAA
jgi:hypothetical protein